jgi:dolichyl-diphosphooligosaccharide---protein glycosyltransferase
MRSVGGGYDNESVAVSCLCLTFLLWTYSLSGFRAKSYTFLGVFTGLAYMCMAATWGGFIFVLNMIGLHAFILFLLGRYSNKLYSAYSLWYVIGTIGAMQVPVIGYGPLKSLEQLAPGCVFVLFQMIQLSHSPFMLGLFGFNKKLKKVTYAQRFVVYSVIFGCAGVISAAGVAYLWPRGYFGPLSSRIRGLFVAHTRTGNPLVDSVAEHQPANSEAFFQFLHNTCYTAPVGLAIAVLISVVKPFFKSDQVTGRASQDPYVFVVVYSLVTYGFSTKMNRLMLLMGPVAAVLTGVAFGVVLDFIVNEVEDLVDLVVGLFVADAKKAKHKTEDDQEVVESVAVKKDTPVKNRKGKKDASTPSKTTDKIEKSAKSQDTDAKSKGFVESVEDMSMKIWTFSLVRVLRKAAAVAAVFLLHEHHHYAIEFFDMAREMSVGLSHPSIMFQATLRDGTNVMVDDYREAYWWLRDKTPEDSRVLAWWDYGYQITGIGNRTSIADGNTWNHEHIALIGRCLTSPEKRAHAMIKHLADYVLIWAGGGGDDLAKSPHMARIGNSVFDDICPDDPTCQHFGFHQGGKPTPMMANSLLFKLHRNRVNPQVSVDPKRFKEVFMSEYVPVTVE